MIAIPGLFTDQEAAIAREQLEKDLHSTKVQLRENTPADGTGASASSESNSRPNYELDEHVSSDIIVSAFPFILDMGALWRQSP